MTFLSASTWCLMSWSSFPLRRLRQAVFAATNIWPRLLARTLSTSECACIPSMYCVSTRCYHVRELIGKFAVLGLSWTKRLCFANLIMDLQCTFLTYAKGVWMMKRLIHSLRYVARIWFVAGPCRCHEKVLLDWLTLWQSTFIDLPTGRSDPLEAWMLT